MLLRKFSCDTDLGGAVDSTGGRDVLQRNLDKSGSWATANNLKFNKSKCWILHMGRGNTRYRYGPDDRLESSPSERAFWLTAS